MVSFKELQYELNLEPARWGHCKEIAYQIFLFLKTKKHEAKLKNYGGHWWVEIEDKVIDPVIWNLTKIPKVYYWKKEHGKIIQKFYMS